MTIAEALRSARERYADNNNRLGGFALVGDLMLEASGLNEQLAEKALEVLDECSPGRNFGFWADGGRWTEAGPVYRYDRKPSEVSAIIGKAILRAMAKGAA